MGHFTGWHLRDTCTPKLYERRYTTSPGCNVTLCELQVVGYGHFGDGNLHLNVSAPSGRTPELTGLIEPFVYEVTRAARGSISAEHGLGQMKADYMGCAPCSGLCISIDLPAWPLQCVGRGSGQLKADQEGHVG